MYARIYALPDDGMMRFASDHHRWAVDTPQWFQRSAVTSNAAAFFAKTAAQLIYMCALRASSQADSDACCGHIADLLSTTVPDLHLPPEASDAEAGTQRTDWQCSCTPGPDVLSFCCAALLQLQPASSDRTPLAAALDAVLVAFGRLLDAACSDCSRSLRTDGTDSCPDTAAESPTTATVRALWYCCAHGVLQAALEAASHRSMATFVQQFASGTAALSKLVWEATMQQQAASTQLALHMLLLHISKLISARQPWLTSNAADPAHVMHLDPATLAAWETAAVALQKVAVGWHVVGSVEQSMVGIFNVLKELQPPGTSALPVTQRQLQRDAAAAGMAADDQMVAVVKSLALPPPQATPDQIGCAIAALEIVAGPCTDHVIGHWAAQIANAIDDHMSGSPLASAAKTLSTLRSKAALLTDVFIWTLRHAKAGDVAPSSALLASACRVADALLGLPHVEADSNLARLRLHGQLTHGLWLVTSHALQIVTAVQAHSEDGRAAISQHLGPSFLVKAGHCLTHCAFAPGDILQALQLLCQAVVTEAWQDDASRAMLQKASRLRTAALLYLWMST